MTWVSVKDYLPATAEQYDFKGDTINTSNVVVTNQGAATYTNGQWLIADSDVTEAGKSLAGVTHWMPLPEYDKLSVATRIIKQTPLGGSVIKDASKCRIETELECGCAFGQCLNGNIF